MEYTDFLNKKTHVGAEHGFEPLWMPDKLFDFQKHITTKRPTGEFLCGLHCNPAGVLFLA